MKSCWRETSVRDAPAQRNFRAYIFRKQEAQTESACGDGKKHLQQMSPRIQKVVNDDKIELFYGKLGQWPSRVHPQRFNALAFMSQTSSYNLQDSDLDPGFNGQDFPAVNAAANPNPLVLSNILSDCWTPFSL